MGYKKTEMYGYVINIRALLLMLLKELTFVFRFRFSHFIVTVQHLHSYFHSHTQEK